MFAQLINQRRDKLVCVNGKVKKMVAILPPLFLLVSGMFIIISLTTFSAFMDVIFPKKFRFYSRRAKNFGFFEWKTPYILGYVGVGLSIVSFFLTVSVSFVNR